MSDCCPKITIHSTNWHFVSSQALVCVSDTLWQWIMFSFTWSTVLSHRFPLVQGQGWVVVSAPKVPSATGNKPQHCFFPSLSYIFDEQLKWWWMDWLNQYLITLCRAWDQTKWTLEERTISGEVELGEETLLFSSVVLRLKISWGITEISCYVIPEFVCLG